MCSDEDDVGASGRATTFEVRVCPESSTCRELRRSEVRNRRCGVEVSDEVGVMMVALCELG